MATALRSYAVVRITECRRSSPGNFGQGEVEDGAGEDRVHRVRDRGRASADLLKGQSLHPRSPYEFIDMSVKEPYDTGWKDKVRTRIRRSHGVIALVSKNSLTSSGQKWEIQCAKEEESKPLLGIWAYSTTVRTSPASGRCPGPTRASPASSTRSDAQGHAQGAYRRDRPLRPDSSRSGRGE